MPQSVPVMKKSSSAKKPAAQPKSPLSKKVSRTKPTPAASSVLVSLQEIKDLVEFVAEKQFDEFEVERGDFRLRLHKGVNKTPDASWPQPALQPLVAPPTSAAVATPPALVSESAPPPVTSPTVEAAPEENLHILTSPIVGTFYRSSSPTSEPFVKLGDTVEANQTLCIVEAMKLMNEVQSDVSGTIVKILVENGQPIEYGQPLFGIKV
jgi:acetyl-CoA carboxylase biotin carboxyl carrier protein